MPQFNPGPLRPKTFEELYQIPRSLDQIYDRYAQGRQMGMQAQAFGAQQQAAGLQRLASTADLASQGVDIGAFNPNDPASVQAAIAPLLARRAEMQRMENEKIAAETEYKRQQAKALEMSSQHGAMGNGAEPIAGSPFFRDPVSGMVLRAKPGHKGTELVPLPGQSIGPNGRAVFTSDRGAEGKMLPATNVLTLNEGKAVARILPEVEQAIAQNEEIFGPVLGRVGSANPYNERAQTVDARMRTASQAFGRFMEGGVLRKEDEEKYRAMFPQLKDTPQIAKNKLAIVRRQLAQKYQDDRAALGGSGYDVSGFGQLDIPPSLFESQGSPNHPADEAIARRARIAELRAKQGK